MSTSIPEPTQEVQEEQVSSEETQAPTENPGGNPAWAPILEALPESLHGIITPKLKEWDQGVTKRFQDIHNQYAPFKPFLEQKVDPQRLQVGMQVLDVLDRDPVSFYRNMEQQLRSAGLIEEAKAAAEAAEDAEEEQQEKETVDPRIKKIEEQQQQFMQNLEQARLQQEQQRAQQETDAAVDRELAELQQKYGPLDEPMQRELFLRYLALATAAEQQGAKEPPTLLDAMESLQGFVTYHSQRPRPAAPKVVPPGGGLPAPTQKPVGQLTEAERRERAAQLVRQMMEQ